MRNPQANLKHLIETQAGRFEFFEAIRWLRAISHIENSEIKFRTETDKSFPAGEISRLLKESDTFEVFVNFFGLVGPCGVLPHIDKDLVSGAKSNAGLKGFLDVFDHRLIGLFYSAWAKNRPEISFEGYRKKLVPREDSSTLILMSLCGVSFPSVRDRSEFHDDVFPALSSFLSRNIRTADAIGQCVARQFRLPVKVKEFVREHKHLEPRIRTGIGRESGQFNQLGQDTILGEKVEVHRERFELELGPLCAQDFQSVCPYGKNQLFRKIVDLVLFTLGRPLDVDIRFNADSDAVRGVKLGDNRLGFDSWLNPSVVEPRNDSVKRFHWNHSRED